jgi:membrane protease YdiL (CAAX protease family)
VETHDTVIVPFLIVALVGLIAIGLRSWYRIRHNKAPFPNVKRRLIGFVSGFLLAFVFLVGFRAIPFLIIVILGLPASGISSWYRLKQGKALPPKRKRYSATITFLLFLLILAVVVASREHIVLFPSNLPTAKEWFGGGALLALVLWQVHFRWRRHDEEQKRSLLIMLPENRNELWIWFAVSLVAGVAEECIYRGVAYNVLRQMTGSVAVALIICVAAFGVSHAIYGWRGVVQVSLHGSIFHLMVALTGTLYLAIAVHAAYDFFLGLLVLRLLNRDMREAEQMTQAAPLSQT